VVHAETVAREQASTPMDWLGSDHVGTPTHARNNRRFVFSVRGPCREDIRVSVVQLELDKANPDTGNIRGLNLAAVKHTTVQVSRLPL
jgi:hypothetical protein